MKKKDEPKKERKPLVNWFKREKEIEFGEKTIGGKKVQVTKKVVKAPESVLSKGFTKTVETTKKRSPMSSADKAKRNDKLFKGVVGGAVAVGGGLLANALYKDQYSDGRTKKYSDYVDKVKGDRDSQQKIDAYKAAENKKDDKFFKTTNSIIAGGGATAAAGTIAMSINKKTKKDNKKIVTKVYDDNTGIKKHYTNNKLEKTSKIRPKKK